MTQAAPSPPGPNGATRPGGGPRPSRSRDASRDRTLLLVTGGAVVMAGLLVAGLMLLVTRGGGRTPPGPFSLGSAQGLTTNVNEEGPVYYPDPTGRSAGIWVDLEGGRLVALQVRDPADRCTVEWKAPQEGPSELGHYTDCHGLHLASEQIPRYASEVPGVGDREGLFLVDVRRVLPAPSPPPES